MLARQQAVVPTDAPATASARMVTAHDSTESIRCHYDRPVSDPLFDLEGRVAVVTGGMGQLGAELSVALAERGMRVAILDRATRAEAGVADLSAHLAAATPSARSPATSPTAAPSRAPSGRSRPTGAFRTSSSTPPRSTRRRTRRRRRSGRSRTSRSRRSSACSTSNVIGVVVCCQVIGGAMARVGSRLDRQRLVDLRDALARPADLRLPARGGRGVRQAGRLLGLEVGALQPDALPRDLLGAAGCARQHAHARRDRERPAGRVRRGVHRSACRSGG